LEIGGLVIMQTFPFDVDARYFFLRLILQIVVYPDNTTGLEVEFQDGEHRLNFEELNLAVSSFIETYYPGQIWTLNCSVSDDEKDENYECVPRTTPISSENYIEKLWIRFHSKLDVSYLKSMVKSFLIFNFSVIVESTAQKSLTLD
jgi:hypothetical protein